MHPFKNDISSHHLVNGLSVLDLYKDEGKVCLGQFVVAVVENDWNDKIYSGLAALADD